MKQNPIYMKAGGVRRRALRGSRGGFSLVEVLVAIAILTVGIVAFLQLFPIGLFDLLVASNTSNADRLAQAELSRLTSGNGAQIQQIAAIEQFYSDGTLQLDPQFNPDQALTVRTQDVSTNVLNTGFNYQPSYATAMPDRYGYVGGELVHIASSTASAGNGNAILDFGPIEVPLSFTYPKLWNTATTSGFNSLDPGTHEDFFIHGLPWLGKSGDALPVSNATVTGGFPISFDDPEVELAQDSPEYLIDYNNGAIAFHQPTFTSATKYNQTFVFQVRDSDSSPNAVEPKTFVFQTDWNGSLAQTAEPANTLECWNTTFAKPIWAPLVSTMAAPFTFTAVNQPTTATQTLVLPLIPGSDKLVRDFRETTMPFDDDPYEFQFPANINTSADVTANNRDVYLGQLLFNPRISSIVDNRGNPIQASVDYIVSDWHNIHEDKTVGSQVVTGIGTGGSSGSSVVRLTLNNLLRLNATDQLGTKYDGIGHGGNDVYVYDLDTLTALAAGTDYTVDYANGAVTVLNQPAGEHLRIYYHPAYDWGLSVLKPPSSYSIVVPTGASTVPTLTGQVVLSANQLYFPPADAGRLVQIGNITAYDTSTSSTVSLPSQLITIPTATGASGSQSCLVTSGMIAGANLSSTQTIQNLSVTGASITTRVIWRESNQWRHRDVTTVQLPSAN